MNRVVVNGKRYDFPDRAAVCIKGADIFVDGEKFSEYSDGRINKVEITGNVESLICDCEVVVNGNAGSVDCGGSCNVSKNISGNVTCGGSCNAGGKIGGDIIAGGSVSCGGSWWR